MRHSHAARSDRGLVLVGVLAACLTLAAALGALVSAEMGRSQRAVTEIHGSRAFVAAESGIDTVQVLLNARTWDEDSSLDWIADGEDNDGDGSVDEGDETLVASSELWGSDGVDNDGDGRTDESDELIARVSSTVSVGSESRTLTGWLRSDMSVVPGPPGAVTLVDPLAVIRFNGNSLLIDGRDTNLDGSAGPEKPLYGLAMTGDVADALDELSKPQQDNLVGLGGSPSAGSWSPDEPDFIPQIFQAFGPKAARVLVDYVGTLSEGLGNASTDDYQITLSKGNLKVGGGSSGAGMLLVEGDLEIAGGWDFTGLVVTTGRFIMKGGGSDIRLRGAAFVGGDLSQPTASISGNVTLQYSSEALRFLRDRFGDYTVSALVEG